MSTVQSLTPQQTAAFLQQHPEAVFADVRSSMEFLFVGHPKGALNIAWIDEPDWQINPDFALDILKLTAGKAPDGVQAHDVPVLLICRSGVRSLEAGEVLVKAGFRQVFNVLEGFEGNLDERHHRSTLGGWRFHDLPWEQC